mgnify:CR=1 FL=1
MQKEKNLIRRIFINKKRNGKGNNYYEEIVFEIIDGKGKRKEFMIKICLKIIMKTLLSNINIIIWQRHNLNFIKNIGIINHNNICQKLIMMTIIINFSFSKKKKNK